MIDLSTEFVGLKLKNPLVPSASPLTKHLDNALRLEDAGAAALVMYSLFEEELQAEEAMAERFLMHAGLGHAEADGFLPDHGPFQTGLERYLEQLQTLKTRLEIPVIASLNGVSRSGWVELGQAMEQAGADALELNVYHVAADVSHSGDAVEARYLDLLFELRQVVKLPIVMKLSPYFSSLPHFVRQLEQAGAQGVTLFNRFVQPDIDLETLTVSHALQLSGPDEALLRVRWLSILFGRVKLDLAASGGVHGHEDALKMLLAGAGVVQLASALLQHGPEKLTAVLEGLTAWLTARDYASVRQLVGSMSQKHLRDPAAMERADYVHMINRYEPPRGVWR